MDVSDVVFIIVGLALIGFIAWFFASSLKRDKQKPAPEKDRFKPQARVGADPYDIKVGALVEYTGTMITVLFNTTVAVRGSLSLIEDSFRWDEFLVELDSDTTGRYWISREADPDVELTFWTQVEDFIPGSLNVGDQKITYLGVTYRLREKGTASYVSEGTTGLPPTGQVEYFDYRSSDGRLLSFEHFLGETWEMALGEELDTSVLVIHPAPVGT